jgi:hypothetical protein
LLTETLFNNFPLSFVDFLQCHYLKIALFRAIAEVFLKENRKRALRNGVANIFLKKEKKGKFNTLLLYSADWHTSPKSLANISFAWKNYFVLLKHITNLQLTLEDITACCFAYYALKVLSNERVPA